MTLQETLLNNRYRLITQHGAGGMAVIYKAEDVALDRVVAVKILRPSLTKDASFLDRFRQEARSAAGLAHPNIVTVHDFGQDGNTHYMVMEFVEGEDLKRLIRAEAPFSIDRALEYAIQICAGVGYAHRAALVHSDIKPQNVLITESEIVKVTDFGIARALPSTSVGDERESIVWGSPHYFAPEQAQGYPPGPAADVYAIGVVLFEMLTGVLPFSGKDHKALARAHVKNEPPFICDINPAIPLQLGRIIRKVMAKEPAARYRTANQLERILRSYRQQGDQTTGEPAAVSYGGSVGAEPTPVQPEAPFPQYQPYARPPQPDMDAPYFPHLEPTRPPATKPTSKKPKPGDRARLKAAKQQPKPGNNCLSVLLGLLALLFVLGLIPLWLRVYYLWIVLGGGY